MRALSVPLAGREYSIWIGATVRQRLADVRRGLAGVRRVAVIADKRVADLHLRHVVAKLDPPPEVLTFPPGEGSKTVGEAERLCGELAKARLGRLDLIVTLGGGVAGDLGGFVAATWLRGIRYVQMPTTLLAAIDASIGGKTGVNHVAGKNLIGAFHQPSAVLVDLEFLKTLPQRELIGGLGESIKHAVIRDPTFFAWHEQHAAEILAREPRVLEDLIARNCEIKADVVARDEREADLRMILNHGHTIGHAIEHLLNYGLRHGECVALGMLVENMIARRRGILQDVTAERIAQLIKQLGLPTHLPQRLDAREVAAVAGMDKKVREGAVNFILLRGLGEPVRLADVSTEEIGAALESVQPG